jgi:hypothetical protein
MNTREPRENKGDIYDQRNDIIDKYHGSGKCGIDYSPVDIVFYCRSICDMDTYSGNVLIMVKRGFHKYKYDDYTSIKFYFLGPLIEIWRFKRDRMYSIEVRWHHNGL